MKVTVYPGLDGWRWSIKGLNNEILASGEAYVRRRDAEDVVKLLFGSTAPIEVSVRGHDESVTDHYILRGGLGTVYDGPLEDTNIPGLSADIASTEEES